MNILSKLHSVIGDADLKIGFMPDTPDNLSALFEYGSSPPLHSFGGGMDITENVQLRCRGNDSYEIISALAERLNHYSDAEISIIQTTSVIDIGRDSKKRQEYTVNFRIIHL